MHFKIFLQQMRRGGRRTALYVLLLTAATAFFVMSVNLYRNSVANLESAEENYSTIAVMELYGDVDWHGNLVEPYSEEHAGYRSVAVEGYDISDIVTAGGVTGWDLRSKYAAYIEGHPAMWTEANVLVHDEVLRFKIIGDEPVKLPISWDGKHPPFDEWINLQLEVLDSAAGCFQYSTLFLFDGLFMSPDDDAAYREQVRYLNRGDETEHVILYPGVEYIATIWTGGDWKLNFDTGMLELQDEGPRAMTARFYPNHIRYGYTDLQVYYGSSAESMARTRGSEAGQPFPIQRWEDVQNDPELKAYFDGAWESMPISIGTFTVELTNDMTGVPVYHLGGASLKEGRLITEEEYESGARVCMVSDQAASLQGWEVGDRLNMNFYEFEAMVNFNDEWGSYSPFWHRETEGFFDEGEYEIVGIYAQNAVTGNSGIARSTLSVPWYTIYVPEKSVDAPKTAEELPVHGARLTIWLENGSIDPFLADMEALGLTEEQEGRYNPAFTFFDQGYSLVQPGLEAMHGTARLLLALSSVLLIVTCSLLAFFFAQNQRQSVGIFRMLGGSKAQALSAVLLCALLVAAGGAALGALAGYGLTQTVGAEIMADNLAQSEAAAALQAFVLESGKETRAPEVRAAPGLTAASAGAAMALPVLLILLFVLLYINREPRALLPRGEG